MNKFIFFILIIIFAFVSDQFSKFYAVDILAIPHEGLVEIYPPLLNFRYVENYGINFGLFGENGDLGRWVISMLTLIIVGYLSYQAWKMGTKPALIFGGLAIGGALGNIFDRIFYGYVIDFINNGFWGYDNPFSYNLADIWIFVGLIGMLIFIREPSTKTS